MFYADYDEEYGGWCVFHTETSRTFATYASEEEAEQDVRKRNKL